jgi:hypothetical protein
MKINTKKRCATAKVVAKKAVKAVAEKPAKPVAKAVTFTVHADKGKSVYLAGEFNGGNPSAKKMAYKARAGDYQYKFVVDGTWCADPENVNSVPNDQGTFNSLVTVK